MRNVIIKCATALRNKTGHDDEGRPAPDFVITMDGECACIHYRGFPDPIIVPEGHAAAVFVRAIGPEVVEVSLERWERER